MARVSIYVPDDLKARMDEAGEAINWSEVARPAFLSAIAGHEHRKGQSVSTIVERLRASKEKYIQSVASYAKEAGRRWASDQAEYDELRRVAAIVPEGSKDWASEALYQAIDPEAEMSTEEYYDYIGDEEYGSEEYAEAFIEGARALYDEVKDEL